MSKRIEGVIEQGHADARTLVGSERGVIMSGESSTANVFRIVEAIAEARGGNLVTTDLEHPCTYSATRYYAAKRGLEWRVAKLQPPTGIVTPEAVAVHVDDQTSAVVIIHASNVIGTRIDIAAVARAVAERNRQTLIVVDGTQHAPHGVVDVEALGVDAYVFAPYKMFSIIGTCFAWLSDRMATLDHPRLAGTSADRWNLGTRRPGAFAAWSKTVDYLAWLGEQIDRNADTRRAKVVAAMRAIDAHEAALSHRMLDGLAQIDGLTVYGLPRVDPMREAVFAVAKQGMDAGDLVQQCRERGVIVHDRKHDVYSTTLLSALGAPACVRMSIAHYNSMADVDAALNAIR